jgi:hypothetical protein
MVTVEGVLLGQASIGGGGSTWIRGPQLLHRPPHLALSLGGACLGVYEAHCCADAVCVTEPLVIDAGGVPAGSIGSNRVWVSCCCLYQSTKHSSCCLTT